MAKPADERFLMEQFLAMKRRQALYEQMEREAKERVKRGEDRLECGGSEGLRAKVERTGD